MPDGKAKGGPDISRQKYSLCRFRVKENRKHPIRPEVESPTASPERMFFCANNAEGNDEAVYVHRIRTLGYRRVTAQ